MPQRERDNFTSAARNELRAWSNGRCMICLKSCAGEREAEAAHIIPASGNGPRAEYRNGYSEEFITSSKNGLWLCPNCHKSIDRKKLPTKTYEELVVINKRFSDSYNFTSEFGSDLHIKEGYFQSLADKIKAISNLQESDLQQASTLEKIPLNEKNEKNNLSQEQIRKIRNFHVDEFVYIYEAVNSTEVAVEAAYLALALKALYCKLKKDKTLNQSQIFDKIIEIMKTAISNYNLDEFHIVSYYYILCEILEK